MAALQGLGADRKLIVILGGEGKGQDFSPLADPIARYARAVGADRARCAADREVLSAAVFPWWMQTAWQVP